VSIVGLLCGRLVDGERAGCGECARYCSSVNSSILVIDRLSDKQRKKLIQYGANHKIMIFSPFEEDIDAGIAVGFRMRVKVKPLFNRQALDASELQLHPLVLKAGVYVNEQ
jgi:hypothetical protein